MHLKYIENFMTLILIIKIDCDCVVVCLFFYFPLKQRVFVCMMLSSSGCECLKDVSLGLFVVLNFPADKLHTLVYAGMVYQNLHTFV